MAIYCNDPTQYKASEVFVNGERLGEFKAPVEVEKIFLGGISISWKSYAKGTGRRPDALYPYVIIEVSQGGILSYPFLSEIYAQTSIPTLNVVYPTSEGQLITIYVGASNQGLIELVTWYGQVGAKTLTLDKKRWKIRITESA